MDIDFDMLDDMAGLLRGFAEQLGELSPEITLSADCRLTDPGGGAVNGGGLDAGFWQNGLCEVVGRVCLHGRVPLNKRRP